MANFNFNKVILGGRLTADPELNQTTTGKLVTSFNLAINRRVSKESEPVADFLRCVAWDKSATFINEYFKKGDCICIEGQIQTRSWTDNLGVKHYATDIVVERSFFVESKTE